MTRSCGRHRSAPSDRRLGLTLVEVLIVIAIVSILLMVLADLLRGTRAGEAALERTLDPVQTLDLAAELLAEEASLAGSAPWPPATEVADLPGGLEVEAFLAQGVVVEAVAGGHRITVRYVDDRLADGPRARTVTFDTGLDARSLPQLYRRPGSSPRQPLVEGVEGLGVEQVIQAGESRAPSAALVGEPVQALVVSLGRGEHRRHLLIELPSRPPLGVAP